MPTFGGSSVAWLTASFRRTLTASTVLFFVAIAAWSLATPLLSGPDETSHMVRAVAVVRGEWVGRTVAGPQDAWTNVTVPTVFQYLDVDDIYCFNRNAFRPAWCGHPIAESSRSIDSVTYVGRYPPLYYALVGLPSLAFVNVTGMWAMRVVSALLSSILLGLAVASVVRWSRRRFLLVGLVLAATPTLLYLGGVVNPSGLECAAAICLWSAGLVLVTEHADAPPRGLLAVVAGAATVLTLARAISPLWTGLIFGFLALQLGWAGSRALIARRDVIVATIVPVLAGVFTVWWVLIHHSFDLLSFGGFAHASNTAILRAVVGQSGHWLIELVGLLGANNVALPTATTLVFFVGVGGLTILGIALVRTRQAVLLALLVLATLLIPIALQSFQARRLGLVYQGRYTLPLAVGIPLTAAAYIDASQLAADIRKRLAFLAVVGVFAAQLLAFAQVERRFAVGQNGTLLFWSGRWSPPAGTVATCLWYVAGVGLLLAFVWGVVTAGSTAPDSAVTDDGVGEPVLDRLAASP